MLHHSKKKKTKKKEKKKKKGVIFQNLRFLKMVLDVVRTLMGCLVKPFRRDILKLRSLQNKGK